VTDVRLSSEAVKDLDHMIASHNLPLDTRERVRRRLEPLERFPRLGKELGGRWQPLRIIYGPWPWMFILYSYEEARTRSWWSAFRMADHLPPPPQRAS
jgi:hypothetical protein